MQRGIIEGEPKLQEQEERERQRQATIATTERWGL